MWKNIVVFVALACLILSPAACYGPFNLTRQVYDWNVNVGNKWGAEAIFFIFIIPVYGITMFGDAILFNSIQFWGGENPFSPPERDLDIVFIEE